MKAGWKGVVDGVGVVGGGETNVDVLWGWGSTAGVAGKRQKASPPAPAVGNPPGATSQTTTVVGCEADKASPGGSILIWSPPLPRHTSPGLFIMGLSHSPLIGPSPRF